MEYILNVATGELDFDRYRTRYRTYVESIRRKLPVHVYGIASNPDYFNLDSRSSLHDAWLETLRIREVASGERNQIRQLEIQLTLLAPHHDRWIHFRYAGVTQYSFYGEAKHKDSAQGDLLTHEIRLGRDGMLVHELLFERGSTLLIECAHIEHSEEPRVTSSDSLQTI